MTKIEHYDFTYQDFLMLRRVGDQKETKLAKHDFTNTTVFKKWGFEYMFMENEGSCGWFLHINKHFGTSLHCHKTKQTVVCVVSGLLLLTTAKRRQLLQPGDMAIIDKKVFHAMGAVTENTKVIEIETPSYKPDSIRAVDFWKREGKPYEEGCLVMSLEKTNVNQSTKRNTKKIQKKISA